MSLRAVTLEGGERIRAHLKRDCGTGPCPIHKRTDHSMRHLPQHWRGDRKIMERTCRHGVGHPDPDEPMLLVDYWNGVHGCCGEGCCHG